MADFETEDSSSGTHRFAGNYDASSAGVLRGVDNRSWKSISSSPRKRGPTTASARSKFGRASAASNARRARLDEEEEEEQEYGRRNYPAPPPSPPPRYDPGDSRRKARKTAFGDTASRERPPERAEEFTAKSEKSRNEDVDVEMDTRDDGYSAASWRGGLHSSSKRRPPPKRAPRPWRREERRGGEWKKGKGRDEGWFSEDDSDFERDIGDDDMPEEDLFREVNELREFPRYTGRPDDMRSIGSSVIRRATIARDLVTPEYLSNFINNPFMKFLEEACGEVSILFEAVFFRRPPLDARTYDHFRPHMNPTFVAAVSRTSFFCDLFSRRHLSNRSMNIDDVVNYYPSTHSKHDMLIMVCAVVCGCFIRKNIKQNPTKTNITKFDLSSTLGFLNDSLERLEFEIKNINVDR